MSSISEKIAAAKAAQEKNRPHVDVTVSLDTSLQEERDRLNAEADQLDVERARIVKSASETLALEPDTTAVDKRLKSVEAKLAKLDDIERDRLVTICIYRAPGDQWFELKAAHPARLNSVLDRSVEYNTLTLTKAAVQQYGVIIDGQTETPPTDDEWAEIWPLLSGGAFSEIADAVYGLNVGESLRQVERLKNSFEAATASAKK